MQGFISKIFDWLMSPMEDDSTATQWLAGLVVILILSFLWSTVIKNITSEL